MEYSIKLNAVNNPEAKVKAFASVTLGDSFKITNVAIVEGKEKNPFVSMPSYKTKQTDGKGKSRYQDVCFSVTKEFREKLYGEILKTFKQEKERKENQHKGQSAISEQPERERGGKNEKQYAH